MARRLRMPHSAIALTGAAPTSPSMALRSCWAKSIGGVDDPVARRTHRSGLMLARRDASLVGHEAIFYGVNLSRGGTMSETYDLFQIIAPHTA